MSCTISGDANVKELPESNPKRHDPSMGRSYRGADQKAQSSPNNSAEGRARQRRLQSRLTDTDSRSQRKERNGTEWAKISMSKPSGPPLTLRRT
ncbi:hypothetical protein MRX96_042293 [Rhipicephalus microplus]